MRETYSEAPCLGPTLGAPTLYSRLHNLNLQLPSASCGHLDLLFTCVRSAILPKLEPTGKLQHPCCSCSMLQGEHWEDEAALKELHARPPLHLNCKLMMPTIIDVHSVCGVMGQVSAPSDFRGKEGPEEWTWMWIPRQPRNGTSCQENLFLHSSMQGTWPSVLHQQVSVSSRCTSLGFRSTLIG